MKTNQTWPKAAIYIPAKKRECLELITGVIEIMEKMDKVVKMNSERHPYTTIRVWADNLRTLINGEKSNDI